VQNARIAEELMVQQDAYKDLQRSNLQLLNENSRLKQSLDNSYVEISKLQSMHSILEQDYAETREELKKAEMENDESTCM